MSSLPAGSSRGKIMEISDMDWANENHAPYQPTVDPRNLMADLIEYASVVMQGIRGGTPFCINSSVMRAHCEGV